MLDWVFSQDCRNTLLLHTVDQLMRNSEKEMLFYQSESEIRHRLNGPMSNCKSAGVFPRTIA